MNVGLVIAVEDDSLKRLLGGGMAQRYDLLGVRKYRIGGHNVYSMACGAGEINAAMSTQHLIDRYAVSLIINYGVAGACSNELVPNQTVRIDSVFHYDRDLSGVDGFPVGYYQEFESEYIRIQPPTLSLAAERVIAAIPAAVCASGDKFLAAPEKKAELHEKFGADVCDMEAAGIAVVCRQNGVGCIAIKTISDSVEGGGEEYWEQKERSADEGASVVGRLLGVL